MSDPDEIRARASEAKELLESKAFQYAILELRKRWFGEFMNSTDDSSAAIWRAKFQTLESIPVELQMLINDHKVLRR